MRTTFVPGEPGVDAYRLLTALVVPRPIAWVSTVSDDGVGNLAPYSFFSIASANPPMVLFVSVGRTDTLDNVLATGEFVVNVSPESLMEQVNATSAHVPADVDEATLVCLATESSDVVGPVRVVDSPASLECRVASTHPAGDSTIVVGEVVSFSVRRDVLTGSHPRVEALEPVSRLGDDEWGLPPAAIKQERPE